jgi:hypothetical protein
VQLFESHAAARKRMISVQSAHRGAAGLAVLSRTSELGGPTHAFR